MHRSSEPARVLGSTLLTAIGRTAGSVIGADRPALEAAPMTLLGKSFSEGARSAGWAGWCPDLQGQELVQEQPRGDPAADDPLLQHVDEACSP